MAFDIASGATPKKSLYGLGAGGLCILLLVLEVVPQNHRGLLVKDDAVGQAKAFAAVVAPLDPNQSRIERGTLNHLAAVTHGAHKNRRPGRGTPDGQQVFADAGTAPFPATVPADAGSNPNLSDSGQTPGAGGSARSSSGGLSVPNPPGPLGAGSTTSSSSSGGSTGGTTTSTGGTTNTSTGGTTTTSTGGTTTTSSGGTTTPVPAVPEPGTWLTMLVGFFMIGGIIRRRPRSLQAA